jgi:hypothetical protein
MTDSADELLRKLQLILHVAVLVMVGTAGHVNQMPPSAIGA